MAISSRGEFRTTRQRPAWVSGRAAGLFRSAGSDAAPADDAAGEAMKRLRGMIALLMVAPFAAAAPPATQPAPAPRADTAIDLALLHLERRQHAEGHFQSDPKLAVTGLVLTSYLACAHAPDVGRHGATVRRAINYL